jgi:hypothetical protein
LLTQIVVVIAPIVTIVGLFWAYRKEQQSRINIPRVQLELKAAVCNVKDSWYLLATIRATNIGQRIVKLLPPKNSPEGCSLTVTPLLQSYPNTALARPIAAMEGHTEIEPGVSVNAQNSWRYQKPKITTPLTCAWWSLSRALNMRGSGGSQT